MLRLVERGDHKGAMMEIEVCPSGESDEATLRSLSDWLAHEPALKDAVRMTFGPSTGRDGDMGGLLPEFIVLLSTAGQILEAAKFVATLAGWVKERGHLPGVVVRSQRGAAVVDRDDPQTVAEVERVIADEDSGDK